MCQIIVTKKFKDIETPNELVKEFPNIKMVLNFGYRNVDMEACLCQIDIKKTLLLNKIKYNTDDNYEFYLK